MYGPGKAGYPVAFLTSSGLVHTGRCNLWAVHLLAAGAVGAINVYDGVDANGRQMVPLGAPANAPDDFGPSAPIYFDKGIWVQFSGTVSAVAVVFEPLGDVGPLA